MTDAAQVPWRYLRDRQLSGFKFRRQHEIDHYIVDFACAEALLVVDLDGRQHADQVMYDERCTQQLQAMGYCVLRFWNNDVLLDIESVLTVMLDTLASPAPHPDPLSHGGYLRVAQRGEGASVPESEE